MADKLEIAVSELKSHAAHINSISTADPVAYPFYELMSGALVWPDETTRQTPTKAIWALRPIFAYRTRAMFGERVEELEAFWNYGKAVFPMWVGFRPERCVATDELREIYRAGRIRMRACLRAAGRE